MPPLHGPVSDFIRGDFSLFLINISALFCDCQNAPASRAVRSEQASSEHDAAHQDAQCSRREAIGQFPRHNGCDIRFKESIPNCRLLPPSAANLARSSIATTATFVGISARLGSILTKVPPCHCPSPPLLGSSPLCLFSPIILKPIHVFLSSLSSFLSFIFFLP